MTGVNLDPHGAQDKIANTHYYENLFKLAKRKAGKKAGKKKISRNKMIFSARLYSSLS
ncbi:hypothetical protein [Xenorhabdus doucetiae]|uniref:Uncharacterized protein n=1 Tax=Xenorhabdus doucetiae TaxID=351671 RepID=A0A068QML6_9GAMM|nr:hypothetical protein [Xenorhabdus doucetiae]CDG16157.1 protein of unknown function [Xenorhabdus doucetiae]